MSTVNRGSTAARAPSLWLDPAPDPGPPLEGAIEADAVVIGAGYTGLWTALALRERGADVVVLERNYGGFGASGRNAGHLTPTIGKDLPTLLRLYGRERGGALVRFAEAAVEHVEAAISDRGIDCDYVAAGNVLAGVHPGQRPGLEKAAGAARQLGGAMRMLDPSELTERDLPRFVACGYLEERGGVLHPGKYVRARARAGDRGGGAAPRVHPGGRDRRRSPGAGGDPARLGERAGVRGRHQRLHAAARPPALSGGAAPRFAVRHRAAHRRAARAGGLVGRRGRLHRPRGAGELPADRGRADRRGLAPRPLVVRRAHPPRRRCRDLRRARGDVPRPLPGAGGRGRGALLERADRDDARLPAGDRSQRSSRQRPVRDRLQRPRRRPGELCRHAAREDGERRGSGPSRAAATPPIADAAGATALAVGARHPRRAQGRRSSHRPAGAAATATRFSGPVAEAPLDEEQAPAPARRRRRSVV